jgi:hypothetical protein
MRSVAGWFLTGALAAGLASVGFWQHATAQALRVELRAAREAKQAAIAAHANGVQAEMARESAAIAPADARADIAALTSQLAAAKADAAARAEATRFAVDVPMPASEWRNAGHLTPKAALETVLWAGAGGDVDALAQSLFFLNNGTRQAARALWQNAPAATREQYDTPERLLAFLAMKDMPMGTVQVRHYGDEQQGPQVAPRMDVIEVVITDGDRRRKSANLVFLNPGDGWKLAVTEPVVAKYAATLTAPVVTTAGKRDGSP